MRPLDVLVFGKTAIDQVVDRPDVAGGQLLQTAPRHPVIGTGGVDIDGDDDLALRLADDLQVVGWPKPTIGHLHRACFGVGGRGARLLLLFHLRLVGLGAAIAFGLQLFDAVERRLDPVLLLARGTLLRCLPAAIASRRIVLCFLAQPRHPVLRRLRQFLQAGAPAERAGSRRRAHPQTVLRQHLQRHQTFGHQRRNTLGEKPLQHIAMVRPEIGQVVIVHRHSAAQPAIGHMLSAQPIQLAGAADPLDGGPQPQRQQQLRCRRRLPRLPLARLTASCSGCKSSLWTNAHTARTGWSGVTRSSSARICHPGGSRSGCRKRGVPRPGAGGTACSGNPPNSSVIHPPRMT